MLEKWKVVMGHSRAYIEKEYPPTRGVLLCTCAITICTLSVIWSKNMINISIYTQAPQGASCDWCPNWNITWIENVVDDIKLLTHENYSR